MTNRCKNVVTISNDDREVINPIADAFERDELFGAFISCPKEFQKSTSLKPNDGSLKRWRRSTALKIGTCGAWIIGVPNWDTGRSHGRLTVVHPMKIKLDVKTAWTPPISIFDRWVDLGCHVRARFEPEMDVAGTYVDKSVNAIRLARVRNEASRMNM